MPKSTRVIIGSMVDKRSHAISLISDTLSLLKVKIEQKGHNVVIGDDNNLRIDGVDLLNVVSVDLQYADKDELDPTGDVIIRCDGSHFGLRRYSYRRCEDGSFNWDTICKRIVQIQCAAHRRTRAALPGVADSGQLTDEQMEAAAIHRCQRRGLDPYQVVSPHGHGGAPLPRWEVAALDLRDIEGALLDLEYGRNRGMQG